MGLKEPFILLVLPLILYKNGQSLNNPSPIVFGTKNVVTKSLLMCVRTYVIQC